MDRIKQSADNDKHYKHYRVPNTMVLFARDDLVKLLENHGMTVEKSYSFKIPTVNNPNWQECQDEESDLVGVVARKNEK